MIARSQGGLHSTGRNEKIEHSLKRIWNEYIYQKDKGIEDKQTKVCLNCCQNTHGGKTTQVKEFGYLVSMIRLQLMPNATWRLKDGEETLSKRKGKKEKLMLWGVMLY